MTIDGATGLNMRLSRVVNGSLSVQDIHVDNPSVQKQKHQHQQQQQQERQKQQLSQYDKVSEPSFKAHHVQHPSDSSAASHRGSAREKRNTRAPQHHSPDATVVSAGFHSRAMPPHSMPGGSAVHSSTTVDSAASLVERFSEPLTPSLSPSASRPAPHKSAQHHAAAASSEDKLALRAAWKSGRDERVQRRRLAQASVWRVLRTMRMHSHLFFKLQPLILLMRAPRPLLLLLLLPNQQPQLHRTLCLLYPHVAFKLTGK